MAGWLASCLASHLRAHVAFARATRRSSGGAVDSVTPSDTVAYGSVESSDTVLYAF